MPRKIKMVSLIIVILLLSGMTISASSGWHGYLAQMDMPTDTAQPDSIETTPSPQAQDTPTPMGDLSGNSPSPIWTSIFTGFTPYPYGTGTYYPMGGSGMGGGGCGGGGMGSMGVSGTLTPGSMGVGMDMGSCPMMGSMNMSSMNMSSGSMAGMDMSGGYSISGMDITGSSYVQSSSTNPLSNPWLLIGWVLLGLLVLAILAGAGVGIAWLIRRSQHA